MLKPIVAAVVGGAYGGGVEMLLNCDIVVASEDAKFGLPEVKRGVVAVQGGMIVSMLNSLILPLTLVVRLLVVGIPRLVHIAGHQVRNPASSLTPNASGGVDVKIPYYVAGI